jgi:multimeric flavodoxin WrbA
MEVSIMKVLGIVASPRKEGNTEILVREALTAAKDVSS